MVGLSSQSILGILGKTELILFIGLYVSTKYKRNQKTKGKECIYGFVPIFLWLPWNNKTNTLHCIQVQNTDTIKIKRQGIRLLVVINLFQASVGWQSKMKCNAFVTDKISAAQGLRHLRVSNINNASHESFHPLKRRW